MILTACDMQELFFGADCVLDTLCALLQHNKYCSRDKVFKVLRVALNTPLQLQMCVDGVTLFMRNRLMLPYSAMSSTQRKRLYEHITALKDSECFSGSHDLRYYYVLHNPMQSKPKEAALVYANSVNLLSAFITLVHKTPPARLHGSTHEQFASIVIDRLVACSNLDTRVVTQAYAQATES